MADHMRIAVYLRAEETRRLRSQGKEPAEWVRRVIGDALGRAGDERVISDTDTPSSPTRPPEQPLTTEEPLAAERKRRRQELQEDVPPPPGKRTYTPDPR